MYFLSPTHREKWDDDDLEMLKGAVKRFGDDLSRLTDRIKDKNNSLVKQDVKKKTYEASGVATNSKTVTSETKSQSMMPQTTAAS